MSLHLVRKLPSAVKLELGKSDGSGNFYRSREQFTETAGILDLDALPDHLPLVECGSSCSCSLECDNRITQRGVR